jgi:hypothetical protein
MLQQLVELLEDRQRFSERRHDPNTSIDGVLPHRRIGITKHEQRLGCPGADDLSAIDELIVNR